VVNASDYEICVFWSDEDQEWVGTCPEFPSLSWLDKSEDGARSGMLQLIDSVLADMNASGEAPPRPRKSDQRGFPAAR
jgi:predicted RNase H-like HicB family nuclease